MYIKTSSVIFEKKRKKKQPNNNKKNAFKVGMHLSKTKLCPITNDLKFGFLSLILDRGKGKGKCLIS